MHASRARPVFPFTALVGQERMKTALLLNAVNPRLGGVLIRGEKGTAKSTAVRALASLLPEIDVVAGCPYGCDPDRADALCDGCAERRARGEVLPRERRPVPLVELPVGATADRVVGTLDLERAIQEGRRHFEPGLLARANRGILYVDEVNLLDDHLVDVLLDAAAMGRNYVEREGISVSHPSELVLVGTMNPEEGDLRPQLLDRFALMVEVEGLAEPAMRAEVVRRRVAFDRDPAAFGATYAPEEAACRERIAAARQELPRVELDDSLLDLIARVCAAFEVDGLRADIVTHRAATTLTALDGRATVTTADVRAAAVLALPHRRRTGPFDQPGLDRERLDRIIGEYEQHRRNDPQGGEGERDGCDRGGAAAPAPPVGAGGGPSPERDEREADRADQGEPSGREQPATRAAHVGDGDAVTGELGAARGNPAPDRVAAVGIPQAAFPLELPRQPRPRLLRAGLTSGRRNAAPDRDGRGAYVGSREPAGRVQRLALASTLRAAAVYQKDRAAALTQAARVEAWLPTATAARHRGRPAVLPADTGTRRASGRAPVEGCWGTSVATQPPHLPACHPERSEGPPMSPPRRPYTTIGRPRSAWEILRCAQDDTREGAGRRREDVAIERAEAARPARVGFRPSSRPSTAGRRGDGQALLGEYARRPAILLRPSDLRERVHAGRASNLVLFLLDASGSMGARQRMAATKTAMLSLLLDAYRKRDRIGLVVFRDDRAALAVPPTNSVDLAQRRLANLPTGGRTPLASGLLFAGDVFERHRAQRGNAVPLLVLVSDGRPNALAQGDPLAEAMGAARHVGECLARRGGRALVVDTEQGRTRLGLARELAEAMHARYMHLDALRAAAGAGSALERSVRLLGRLDSAPLGRRSVSARALHD